MKEEVEFKIRLKTDTAQFIEDLVTYENIRSQIITGKPLISSEDIIKAAIYRFKDNVLNEYKQLIVKSLNGERMDGKELKNNFKNVMAAKGIKSKDLESLTGVHKSNLSNIITNKNQPSIDVFLRIWIALDCPPIEELFYRE